MSDEFKGLVAVVTGAGSGIGLAVAQHFHDNGAQVYGLDLQEGSMSPYAHFIHCDIGDPASVSSAFAALAKQTQVIDILANNAGVGATGTVEDASEEEWHKVLNINVVNPGTSDTPWVARLLSQAKDPVAERAALEARQPLGRLVSATEVASAIAYLASPRQASTTGTILAVDGGMQGLRLPK